MKTYITLFTLLIATSVSSQTNSFSLLDTAIKVGEEYTTRQIHFELGKAILKAESYAVLDSIVAFMNLHTNIKLEIGVHSDSRTNPNCCDNPTQNRAVSIATYLKEHHIAPERLMAKGYGEHKLLIKEEQISKSKTTQEKEALHTLNRRVVLKIIADQ
ncbi:MAG: OmpA family protein [Bacteroidetes bacterium]|nr:OmpA family protein [Bacteroidota bacterium]